VELSQLPPGWGDDSLSSFFEASWKNVLGRFKHMPSYERLAGIDNAYISIVENLQNPPDWFVAMFLPRTHSAYRAAAHLALAGQIPESFMLMRGCVEHAVYGFYLHHNPKSPHRMAASARQRQGRAGGCATNLRLAQCSSLSPKHDASLGLAVKKLYNRTIERGAHPNEKGISQSARYSQNDRQHRIDFSYLSSHNKPSAACLKSTAQVGVAGLKLLRHTMPERFDLLGVTAKIEALQDGL
jgi:hypothetical protein